MTGAYRRILTLVLLLIVPIAALYSPEQNVPVPEGMETMLDGSYFSQLDAHIRDNLPYRDAVRRISLQTGLLSGQSMQNDIFISRDGLIRNISAKVPSRVQDDLDAVLLFAERTGRPTYFMLIPTASAILQQQLPQYAQIYLNQRRFIDDVYRAAAGQVTTVNVYSTLFNRREEYIYYRTEHNLTALGGYYVYATLAGRLNVQPNSIISRYDCDISYPLHQYYGDLFARSPYNVVRPDEVMAFHYNQSSKNYTVTHSNGGDVKTYYTLYPVHVADLGRGTDVFLGGMSEITRIKSSEPGRSILVFGDRTARSYLPFLAANYEDITLVDLSQMSSDSFGSIRPDEYSQILFAFSTDTFGSGTHRTEGALRLLSYSQSAEYPDHS